MLSIKVWGVSTMDGTILSNSIYSLKGSDLRIIYSLLSNMNLRKLLSFNVNKLVTREHNLDYVNFIFDAANEFNDIPDETLQFSLFQEMNKTLSLNSLSYEDPYHIEKQCEAIVEKVYHIYINQEKPFLQFTNDQIEFTRIHLMIDYQLRPLFYEVEHCFQNLSVDEQEEFLDVIYQFIHLLPEDKKWILQQNLPKKVVQIKDLKDIELSTLLIQLSNSHLPSLFHMLTRLMIKYAEKLSITIPLLHHDDISSPIKFVTSPYFITPYVLGGRALQMNYHHQAIKKRLMPFILMQITLPYLCNETSSVSSPVLFQNEWKRRVEEYRRIDYQSTVIEMKHIEISEHHHKCRQRLIDYEHQKNQIEERLHMEIHKLKSTLLFMDINELTINQSFENHRAEYFRIKNKIKQLRLSKREDILETSLMKQVANKLLNMSVTLDQFGKEKKVDELLERLVLDILDSDSHFKQEERAVIKQIQKELKDMKYMIETENLIKTEYEKELIKLNQQLRECSEELKKLENDNYRIKEAVQ